MKPSMPRNGFDGLKAPRSILNSVFALFFGEDAFSGRLFFHIRDKIGFLGYTPYWTCSGT
jgi:hypothetical protein